MHGGKGNIRAFQQALLNRRRRDELIKAGDHFLRGSSPQIRWDQSVFTRVEPETAPNHGERNLRSSAVRRKRAGKSSNGWNNKKPNRTALNADGTQLHQSQTPMH